MANITLVENYENNYDVYCGDKYVGFLNKLNIDSPWCWYRGYGCDESATENTLEELITAMKKSIEETSSTIPSEYSNQNAKEYLTGNPNIDFFLI